VPDQQRHTQILFELSDLKSKRRLGNQKRLGSLRYVAELDRLREVAQLPKVDDVPPTSNLPVFGKARRGKVLCTGTQEARRAETMRLQGNS
jgi:hypothetical protein